MKWLKKNKSNIFALMLGLLMSLIMSEMLLRLYPAPLMSDDVYYRYDKDVGWMPEPNQTAKNYNNCLEINPINFNNNGFRDKEWTKDESYKIAILGDSYMQGSELPEGMVLPSMLAKMLGIQTLNGGINNFATLHEYLLFKKYVSLYKPKLVILFFYAMNDVLENSYALRRRVAGGAEELWPAARLVKPGDVSVIYPEFKLAENSDAIRAIIKRYFKTALLARRLHDYYKDFAKINLRGYGRLGFYQLYMPEDEEWSDAWKITEFYLVQLKQEINKTGGELVVVLIPEYIKISQIWEKELKDFTGIKDIPKEFDLDYPVRRLREITGRNTIRFVDLEAFFKRYRDDFELKLPYFYYRCDGHLNPLGQFLATNLVARYLLANNIVPFDPVKKTNTSLQVETNLKLTPIQILSQEGYDQIYKSGRFKGKTNIIKLLANPDL